jgi:hypothetical protein
MSRFRKVKVAAASLIVTAGLACAMLIPASPAVAYYSGGLFLDITVESPARLLAGGAALDVTVEYTCNAMPTAVSVSVTQRVNGQAIASGYGDTQITCNGAHQRTVVIVTADGNKAFGKGQAFATGRINGCLEGFATCGSESRSSTIKVRR